MGLTHGTGNVTFSGTIFFMGPIFFPGPFFSGTGIGTIKKGAKFPGLGCHTLRQLGCQYQVMGKPRSIGSVSLLGNPLPANGFSQQTVCQQEPTMSIVAPLPVNPLQKFFDNYRKAKICQLEAFKATVTKVAISLQCTVVNVIVWMWWCFVNQQESFCHSSTISNSLAMHFHEIILFCFAFHRTRVPRD